MKNFLYSLLFLLSICQAEERNYIIRMDSPASDWESECLPIGNGRLGAMIYGGIEREQIQFNEDSVWTGDEKITGSYKPLGDLFIDFELPEGEVTQYRRELDLNNAVQATEFEKGGVAFLREAMASHPADVMVFRFSADQPSALTGKISLRDAHDGKIEVSENELAFSGKLWGKHSLSGGTGRKDENYGMRLEYEARVRVLNSGGSLERVDGGIRFKGCDELLIFINGGSDYLNRHDKDWRGKHPHKRIKGQLKRVSSKTWDALLAEHVEDYQGLFNRFSIYLGESPADAERISTRDRLTAYRGQEIAFQKEMLYEQDALDLSGGRHDPGLETLIFQYARYLMIASSREGTLPANLQGIWNESHNPPWRCDYHTNVNIQMNYWLVGPANLWDCFSPLSEWLWSVVPVKREFTRKNHGVRGWVHHSENGIFGGHSYRRSPGDAPWLLQNIWDHYLFTLDEDYLATRAYPLIKEQCEFWIDSLVEWPDGTLVSPKSVSPEHGPWAEGNTYEQQLVHNLFSNFIEASTILDRDEAMREQIREMRSRLLGPRIGSWGQLQEWAEDIDDPNNDHRHIAHLVAVHPLNGISPYTTPELAEAARVSLNARGDGGTGWSKAWKISMWARLYDAERAYKLLREQINGNFFGNLLSFHPPFQIDANFCYASSVCEMLMQSHTGTIDLLPSLPKAWPDGQVRGMRARGGFELDISWSKGELTGVKVVSIHGRSLRLRYSDQLIDMETETGIAYLFDSSLSLN